MSPSRTHPAVPAACVGSRSRRRAGPCVDVEHDRQLRVQLCYPAAETARLWLIGEVDRTNTGRVRAVIHFRLCSRLHVLELDLSRVDFLSAGGARVLARAVGVAPLVETEVRIQPGLSRAARVALHATGVTA